MEQMSIIQYCKFMESKGEGISRQAVAIKIIKQQPIKYVASYGKIAGRYILDVITD